MTLPPAILGWTDEQVLADQQARADWARFDQEQRDEARRYQLRRNRMAIPRFVGKATFWMGVGLLWLYIAGVMVNS